MKKYNLPILVSIALIAIFLLASPGTASAEEIEEAPNMIMPDDNVITGPMSEYSNIWIIVNDIRYPLCKNVKVFNPRNRLMNYKNIDAALEVKLFENKNCVRKIKVLRFAQ